MIICKNSINFASGMEKKSANTLKYILWIALAAVLLYFSFRGVDWAQFGSALASCRWGYVVLSIGLGALVYFLRALRWRMQILPLDPSTGRLTCLNAYNLCMITNLVLPRVGELVRCGYVAKHSARDEEGNRLVSVDKALGTVVLDRLWDALSMGVMILIFLALMWKRFGTYLSENVTAGLLSHGKLWWILGGAVAAGAAFILLCRKMRGRGGLWAKVWNFIEGIGDGLVSCFHMRHGWIFVLYTVLIWGLYWLMSACCIWALRDIEAFSSLTGADALFLTIAGSLSSVIPVPGGFGAYHSVVAGALLSVYGIPFETGLIFATLAHESQVVTAVLAGGVSYIHENFFRG